MNTRQPAGFLKNNKSQNLKKELQIETKIEFKNPATSGFNF